MKKFLNGAFLFALILSTFLFCLVTSCGAQTPYPSRSFGVCEFNDTTVLKNFAPEQNFCKAARAVNDPDGLWLFDYQDSVWVRLSGGGGGGGAGNLYNMDGTMPVTRTATLDGDTLRFVDAEGNERLFGYNTIAGKKQWGIKSQDGNSFLFTTDNKAGMTSGLNEFFFNGPDSTLYYKSSSSPVKGMKYFADYSSILKTNPRSIPDVGTVGEIIDDSLSYADSSPAFLKNQSAGSAAISSNDGNAVLTAGTAANITGNNIELQVRGSGEVKLQGTPTKPGTLEFYEETGNGTNHVNLSPPASMAANYNINLPAENGTLLTDFSAGQQISDSLQFRTFPRNRGVNYEFIQEYDYFTANTTVAVGGTASQNGLVVDTLTYDMPGYVLLNTGATNNNTGRASVDVPGIAHYRGVGPGTGQMEIEWGIRTIAQSSYPNHDIVAGFCSATSTRTASNIAVIFYDKNFSPNFHALVDSSGVETLIDTGVAVDNNTFYALSVKYDDNSRNWYFSINNSQVATIPNREFFEVARVTASCKIGKNTGLSATSSSMYVDYIYHKREIVR
jgi:hypothetical protein